MKPNIVETTRERYLGYEKRHQEILEAAIRLFNSEGYTGATILRIAREARITEPTLYKHFKNKKELFLACFHSITNELFLEYREIYKKTLDDEKGYLRGVLKTYFDFVAENPHKSLFVIHMLSYRNDPEFNDALKEYMENNIRGVERVIASAKKKGKIKSKIDSSVLAGVFVSQYFAVIRLKEFKNQEILTWEMFFQMMLDMLRFD